MIRNNTKIFFECKAKVLEETPLETPISDDSKVKPQPPPLSTTPRPKSSMNSSRNKQNQQRFSLASIESNLTREITNNLKAVSQRKQSKFVLNPNFDNNIYLIDVIQNNEKDENESTRGVSTPLAPFKLSNQFYQMSPRSWNPTVATTLDSKLNPVTPIEQSNPTPQLTKTTDLPSSKILIKKRHPTTSRPSTAVAKVDSNIKIVNNNSISARTRTRPSTARETSKYNLKLNKQYNVYDDDDGRSSKIQQNEEDDNYFGQLEGEFIKESNNNIDFKALLNSNNPNSYYDVLNKLNNELTQSVSSLNLKNINSQNQSEDSFFFNNEDDDDNVDFGMDSMALEELKSLR
jgi:hypothetical protein